MKRIDTPHSVPDLNGPGKSGFVDLNVATGVQGTEVSAAWLNVLQEEVAAPIEAAGLKLSGADSGQLLKAIKMLAAQHGQCRMILAGGNLKLLPFNGNKILINGVVQRIPSAGVSLSATGLMSGTVYYIYAFMNENAITLEAVVSGHVTDSDTGVEVMKGDSSRTLVGMARTGSSGGWVDSVAQRFTLSYFNRRNIGALGVTATIATSSAVLIELVNGSRVEFLSWGDESIHVSLSGYVSNNTAGNYCQAACGADGRPVVIAPIAVSATANQYCGLSTSGVVPTVAEGLNYLSPLGCVNGGVGWFTVQVSVLIRG